MANVLLGRLVKAFGIRGELKLDPSEDFWEEALSSNYRLVSSNSVVVELAGHFW